MVRPPTFDSNGMKKGAWSKEEDDILRAFVIEFGHQNWRRVPLLAGLARCGKSCRLRWVNYLKPGLKRGKITKSEEDLIMKLHEKLGRKWSAIAAQLPGRTDNEIKNYWHAYIKKRGRRGNAESGDTSEDSSPQEKESSSSAISSADHLQGENVDQMDSFDNIWTELQYDQTCLSPLDVGYGIFSEMQYDPTSTFSSSSDSGASPSSADFWSESFGEGIMDVVLW